MKSVKVTKNTGNNEWNTPSKFLESARKVMGKINLDPASNKEAQKYVKAKKYYDIKTDGLNKKWKNKIWMNPPYSRGKIYFFILKLKKEIEKGNVKECIVLTNNATETKWCQILFTDILEVVCFVKGRINFYKPDGTKGPPLQGQLIGYRGKRKKEFVKEYRKYGVIFYVKK
jgi:phage N-6-adenine-methyltransferase